MSKLVFINRYYYPDLSATSQILTDLTNSLAKNGESVTVVTSRLTYNGSSDLLPPVDNYEGVNVLRVWTTNFGRSNLLGRGIDYLSFYVTAFFTLLRITHRNDILIAKTDPPLISVVAWCISKIKGAKLINWLQDIFPEVALGLGVLKGRTLFNVLKFFRNLSLRGASANIVLGSRMYDYVFSQGVDQDKVALINNWSDTADIEPVPREENKLRKTWGLDDKFVIGYSGNLGRAHDFSTIVSSMNYLKDDENIIFIFIGAGAGKDKLIQGLNEHGLTNYAFFPYQSREILSQSLSVPDVHLVSLQPQLEGFIVPSKIYGVFAVARPLIFIGDEDGEVARLISKYKCGYSLSIGSGNALGRQLQKLKTDTNTIHQLGNNGRKCLENHFDHKHAVKQWTSILGKIRNMGTS